jgi:hypothetical protein
MKEDFIAVALLVWASFTTLSVHGAFASSKSSLKKFPPASQAATDEALRIFQAYYPDKKPAESFPWASWGVPSRDLDGSKYAVVSSGKRIFERTVTEQKSTFTELARVYGEKQALEMARIVPTALAFDPSNFAPSLEELIKIFGDDEARAMVGRNPGLLALKPFGPGGAETANKQTMQFSYIISATRPYGRVLLYGLLALLSVPLIESVTGIPIRSTLLHIQ